MGVRGEECLFPNPKSGECDSKILTDVYCHLVAAHSICRLSVHTLAKSLCLTRLPRWRSGKESTCQCRRCRFNPWVGKILWRRKWLRTSVFLPGKFHGQRGVAGYSPWGHKEMDIAEHTPLQSGRKRNCFVWAPTINRPISPKK